MSQLPPQQEQVPCQPPPMAPVPQEGGGKAIAALVLGLVGLLAWCLPIVGLPVTIVGLVLGVKGLKGPSKGMALAGVILCIVGLVASIINAAIGAYMGATGQFQMFQR